MLRSTGVNLDKISVSCLDLLELLNLLIGSSFRNIDLVKVLVSVWGPKQCVALTETGLKLLFSGTECIDNEPPLDGYTCGECPKGYEGK